MSSNNKIGKIGAIGVSIDGEYDLSEWAKLTIAYGKNTTFFFKDTFTKTFKDHGEVLFQNGKLQVEENGKSQVFVVCDESEAPKAFTITYKQNTKQDEDEDEDENKNKNKRTREPEKELTNTNKKIKDERNKTFALSYSGVFNLNNFDSLMIKQGAFAKFVWANGFEKYFETFDKIKYEHKRLTVTQDGKDTVYDENGLPTLIN